MTFSKNNCSFLTRFKRLLEDQRGNTSQVLALAAVPLFLSIGVAVDTARIAETNVKLQSLADDAALAGGASLGNVDAKILAAQKYVIDVQTNSPMAGVTYTPTVTAVKNSATGHTDVTVVLATVMQGLMMPAVYNMQNKPQETNSPTPSGSVNMKLKAVARSNPVAPSRICVHTTDRTAADAIYLNGNNSLTATNCGLHSDSSSATAIHLQGSSDMTADFFEAVGGWSLTGGTGTFSTPPTSGADVMGDIFNLSITNPGAGVNIQPSDGASLAASVYQDITIRNNVTATFTPGIHYITGTIDINNGGTLIGSGVTLVLYGPDARLNMNGGTLQLQAPTTGTYAGFAVVSDATATSANSLQGGPSTFIRGIWNTPNQALNISGNSNFNVSSEYFPVVTKTFNLSGNDMMSVKADFNAYGYADPTALVKAGYNTVYLVQ